MQPWRRPLVAAKRTKKQSIEEQQELNCSNTGNVIGWMCVVYRFPDAGSVQESFLSSLDLSCHVATLWGFAVDLLDHSVRYTVNDSQ